ncbi:MAG TPA: 50S ribosomal protein L11 methyltransferase, partial [Planctomycetota bacterium]|nr:50S ribosomal protein L11 methyltransferase [Planctomycetota bacterium]
YASSWKKSWKPFRVAGFALVPRDHLKPLRPGDQRFVMEPGGAFGTGRHPTTRGCLRAIARRARPGERILDAGFGNGVLAVACALRGAREIVAFDIDAAALPYAELLAADNGVARVCRWRIGGFEGLGPADQGFDGVCANLFADLIQGHAADLARALRPGGWFAISGCRADFREATLRALAAAGLSLEERSTRGRWDTYVGTRSAEPR